MKPKTFTPDFQTTLRLQNEVHRLTMELQRQQDQNKMLLNIIDKHRQIANTIVQMKVETAN